MRDNHAHHIIEDMVSFEGEASITEARLYNCGPFPALKITRDAKDIVHGELFRVKGNDEEQLFRNLDWYEGAPSLFKRTFVVVKCNQKFHKAVTYVFANKLGVNDLWMPEGRW
jgi:gamma-glutamylcyclotransferase (GGCT)/AIG2-like uncharacterized protein YtfP